MRRAAPAIWAVTLAVLVLWQALAPGYVLTYDMVWVPDLALRPDFLGLGTALPRAVPSDAVIAVLDEVVPGMLLQKLVLLGALVLGGLGAARLAPATSTVAQLAAITFYQWNPFVIERLVIGHWPVLLGYAALPWLVLQAQAARRERRLPLSLCLLLPLASLSASVGLMAATVTLLFGVGRRSRANLALVGAVAAANAPWIVTGLLHAGAATSDAAGAEVFALHDAGWLPGPVAALGLGGIWNIEVMPASSTGMLAVVFLVLMLVVCGAGARAWWRANERRDAVAFIVCWVLGWGTAVLTWAVPGLMGVIYDHVPGAGLVRDGSRMLALTAPLLVATLAYGAAALHARAGEVGIVRLSAGAGLVLFPIAALPDAAWGAAGAVQAVDYPHSYDRARDLIDQEVAEGRSGDVVVLPFTSYRAPDWNARHKVLDPVGRFLAPDFVVSDDLTVSGRLVAGEDRRARDVREALAEPTPDARAVALGSLGIGFVVTDRDEVHSGLPTRLAPTVTGTTVGSGPVEVVAIDAEVSEPSTPRAELVAVSLAWTAYVGLLLAGAWGVARRVARHISPR